jgi:putative polyhydroxyalkanoate system protein
MSYIDMHAQHSLGREQAQAAADELATDLAQKFDIAYHWQDDRICFDRSGVNGTITVNEDEIRVEAKLGLVLMFLKGRIEEEIVSYLSDHFGCRFS